MLQRFMEIVHATVVVRGDSYEKYYKNANEEYYKNLEEGPVRHLPLAFAKKIFSLSFGEQKAKIYDWAFYWESSKLTIEVVGKFQADDDLIMSCESDQECIQKQVLKSAEEVFGTMDYELYIHTTDHEIYNSKEVSNAPT